MFFKKKKKSVKTSDKVWISKVEKFRGLYNHLDSVSQSGAFLLIINQFENTHQEVQQMLNKLGLSHQHLTETTTMLEAVNIFTINAESALDLSVSTLLASELANKTGLQAIITEHHPSFRQEQILLGHLQDLLPTLSIEVFTAIEEPFMQVFGGERITAIMERIGVKENEFLEHTMITKSITRAQQKVDKSMGQNITANSQQEWMDKSGL
ncbi:MAG TPA: hypothetical protein DCS93_04575 [Microscillaceae bacterium]|nr:hypothetical protein [Microscillaceae bacterium]